MYISANTEPLVLDLSASGCRSLSLVADFRAANRKRFQRVAMQPGDAIIAKAADCKPDQLELRVFQRTQPLVAMVIWLRLLSAAASSPLIGPAIGQNPQLLSDIIQVTRANWELAFALDLDEFDGTSSERLSYLMKKVLMGGKTVLKLFDLNSMPGSNSSSSMALSYRLLESRTKLDQLHLDAVNNMSNRMDLVWRRKFERSCLLAMAGSRMLDNSIGLPPAERAHELTRLRQMISSESQELLAIWRSMSGTDKASANSLLELAINSTDGKDWRGSLTFLLAMARTVVRQQAASCPSCPRAGCCKTSKKLVRTLLLHTWSMRMESIVEILKRWSEEIRKLYETNLEPMALLSDTFPWRHWIVLAYLEQKSYGGNTGTSVFFCEGLYLSKGRLGLCQSSKALKATARRMTDAFLWQQHAMPGFGTPCVTAAFFGALCYGRCFMVWAARPDRVAYRLMRTAGFMTHRARRASAAPSGLRLQNRPAPARPPGDYVTVRRRKQNGLQQQAQELCHLPGENPVCALAAAAPAPAAAHPDGLTRPAPQVETGRRGSRLNEVADAPDYQQLEARQDEAAGLLEPSLAPPGRELCRSGSVRPARRWHSFGTLRGTVGWSRRPVARPGQERRPVRPAGRRPTSSPSRIATAAATNRLRLAAELSSEMAQAHFRLTLQDADATLKGHRNSERKGESVSWASGARRLSVTAAAASSCSRPNWRSPEKPMNWQQAEHRRRQHADQEAEGADAHPGAAFELGGGGARWTRRACGAGESRAGTAGAPG
uniref:Reverse transcriptase domain-containing protein n=1 Tax=Macrostomum lignano TaxID=282301 RepID=A0A1I8FN62_9PLAT